MPEPRTCPACGTLVPPDSPHGMCPGCAFRTALDAADAPPVPEPDFGEYELLEEIGRGGMGVVFKARQRRLQRIVAVKMLLHGRFSDPAFLRRFQLEAEAAAQLDHPNIVPIFEVGEHAGQPFHAMRWVDGCNLGELVREQGIEPDRAARLTSVIARAVHHAHQHGILHRDLKPHNVLLDSTDQPHLTDFGLAKLVARDPGLTEPGSVLGSPAFMAPEQLASPAAAVTTAADIYSLGAMLYMLLSGRPPVAGNSAVEVLRQCATRGPTPLRSISPSVPRDLATICEKCLQEDPARRYGSAEALAEDLDRWRRREPVLARPVNDFERCWLWCRRQPLRAGLIAALALAVATGAIGITWQWRQAEERRRWAEAERAIARDATANARREGYAATLALAQNLIEQQQFNRALEVLTSAGPESLRGWEWGWLARACHRDLATFSSGGAGLGELAFSPDGRLVACSALDGRIRIWEVETAALRRTLEGHVGRVAIVGGFDHTGGRLVTAGWDGMVKIWEVESGTERLTIPTGTERLYGAKLSPDGARIATGGADGTVRLWDATSGHSHGVIGRYRGAVMKLAWSPDGRHLAFTGGSGNPHVVRPATVDVVELASGAFRSMPVHADSVPGLAYSPDGRWLATASWDGSARIAPADTARAEGWRVLASTPGTAQFAVEFSPDGRQCAVVGGATDRASLQLIEHATGRVVARHEGHSRAVRGVAYHQDGDRIATASFDGTVKFWPVRPRPEFTALEGHGGTVWALAVSPDGRRVATGSLDHTARVWELASGRLLATLPVAFPVISVAFTAGGERLLTPGPGATGRVWRIADPAAPPLVLRGHAGAVMAVAADRQGRWMATCGKDGTVRLWEARGGSAVRTLPGDGEWLLAVAFSPDGARLVAGSAGGTAVAWETASGRRLRVLRGHEQPVLQVAFSPDGCRIATGSADATARLWDSETGTPLGAPLGGHTDGVGGLAFSPDGARLVTSGAGTSVLTTPGRDRSIHVWDVHTGRCLVRLAPHDAPVRAMTFSGEGTRLITASCDHAARVHTAFPWNEAAWPGVPGGDAAERLELFKRAYRASAIEPAAANPRTAVAGGSGKVSPTARRSPGHGPRGFLPRDPDCTSAEIDLTGLANAALDESWQPVVTLWQVDADLREMPAGRQLFGGVAFDARCVVQLAGGTAEWSAFPTAVRVPLGRRFSRLHLLHSAGTTALKEPDGKVVALHRLHFADGATADLEIRYGEDVRTFWASADPADTCTRATMAWCWSSPEARGALDRRRVYLASRANPRPEALVASIEVISTQTTMAPLLVAMTVE